MRYLYTLVITTVIGAGMPSRADEGPAQAASPEELVELLGSSRFSQRKKAMDALLRLGPAALGPLEKAARSPNREVRYRSHRLLESVRELEFERSLQAFIQSRHDPSLPLPGWDRFRSKYGNEGDARQLFVAMQRAEPAIMRSTDGDNATIIRLIDQRVQSFQQARRFQGADITLGTILALVFAGQDSERALSGPTIKTIFSLFGYPAFQGEMYRSGANNLRYIRHDPRSDLLRRLFADWMTRPGAYQHYQGFQLALVYDIPDAVPAAVTAIQKEDASPYVKQYALQVIAEYGKPDRIPVVSTLLSDHTFCAAAQRINDKQYRTQIRDVALVCLLALKKLDPRENGFPRFMLRNRVVQLSSIGFPSDEERDMAHARWHEYLEKEK